MSEEQYRRGLKKLEEMDPGATARITERLQDIAPDLARYVIEFAYGEIYERPGPDLKLRETATVAALTALGTAPAQLKTHIHRALNVGVTRQEVIEIILQMAVYAGFPAALNGMGLAKEVFQERKKNGIH